jgi:hypothetical protein
VQIPKLPDKPAMKTARIQMRHRKCKVDNLVDEVPPTTIPYNTNDPGTFTIDVDMRKLMEMLDDVRSAKEKFRMMGTLVDECKLK